MRASRIVAVTAILSLCAMSATHAQESEFDTSEEGFRTAIEGLNQSLDTMQTYGVPEIMAEIDGNIARVHTMLDRVLEADDVTALVPELAETTRDLAESFRRIADQAPDVFRARVAETRDIEQIQNRAGLNVEKLRDDIAKLEAENRRLDQMLASKDLTASVEKKAQIGIKANEKLISTFQSTAEVWSDFLTRHARLTTTLRRQDEALDLFFYTLDANARVYEAVADNILLRRTAEEILNEIGNFGDLTDVIYRIQESWDDLQAIVNEIESQQFEERARTPSF